MSTATHHREATMTIDPFAVATPAAAVEAATTKQIEFVNVLTAQAAAIARLSGDEARAAVVEGADFSATLADSKATSALISTMVDAMHAARTAAGVSFADMDAEVSRRHAEVTGAARVANATAEVPAGRYAIEVMDGLCGVVKFYKVDRPTEGKWAGRVFVKVMASDDEYPVRGQAATAVLEAIALDVMAASTRYGREIGRCGVCNRTLTDADSREAGIGPVCASRM